MEKISRILRIERDKEIKKQKVRQGQILRELKKVMSQIAKEMGDIIFIPHILKRMKKYPEEEILEALNYLKWNNEVFIMNERVWKIK